MCVRNIPHHFRELSHDLCILFLTMINDGIYGPIGRMLDFPKRNLTYNIPSILGIMLHFPKWLLIVINIALVVRPLSLLSLFEHIYTIDLRLIKGLEHLNPSKYQI